MKPSLDYLKTLFSSQQNLVKAIKRSPWLLSNRNSRMVPNILSLQKPGLSIQQTEKIILRNSRYIVQKPEWVNDLLNRVINEFQLSPKSRMFMYGIDALASLSKLNVQLKVDIFRSYVFTDTDVKALFRKLPYCLALSEVKILKGLSFFLNKLGHKPDYMVSRPQLLMFNLEKRVVPRNEILKILDEKKLKRSNSGLSTAVCMSESRFVKAYILPYEDKVPGLYEFYMKSVGSYIVYWDY